MLRYRLGVGQTSLGQLEELNKQVKKERGLGWVFEEPSQLFASYCQLWPPVPFPQGLNKVKQDTE